MRHSIRPIRLTTPIPPRSASPIRAIARVRVPRPSGGALPAASHFPRFSWTLGQEVEIDAIAAVANLRYSTAQYRTAMTLNWFKVKGSHDGVNWVTLLSEEANLPGEASDPAVEPDSGPGESYDDIFVRPAKRKIGMFDAPGIGPDALDTVTYRYLQFEISRTGLREDTDSTVISEIIIDAVPEPTTLLVLVGVGLFGLLPQKQEASA